MKARNVAMGKILAVSMLAMSSLQAWAGDRTTLLERERQAAEALDTQELVKNLQADPKSIMDKLPPKVWPDAPVIKTKFTAQEILSGEFIQQKDKAKNGMDVIVHNSLTGKVSKVKFGQIKEGRAGIKWNDRPERLVDRGTSAIDNLVALERLGKSRAELSESPWSDYYWPIYSGVLGMRYGHPDWPSKDHQYKDFLQFIGANTYRDGQFVLENLDNLSPSEKYDILYGGVNGPFYLTDNMWARGRSYSRDGVVERWMGICHGWAPAAYMLPRPAHTITVMSVDGQEITFYPSDLKGLATLLWADEAPATRFIGGRCNTKNPEKDAVNGRVKSSECFDTNPGTWHISVINQVGLAGRSFVMDATYDYEVWNQPVYSYSYMYFNPATGASSPSLLDSEGRLRPDLIVRAREWSNDPFRKGEVNYRDPGTQYVVGVKMTVGYVVETHPSQKLMDSAEDDAIVYVTYAYDLELDAQYKIIGGEWYSNKHPDFLWTPAPGARAISSYDSRAVGPWVAPQQAPMPRTWVQAASQAARAGHPLSVIVDALFRLSARK